MKILIAYSTKTGTTADCAAMLGGQLPSHEVTLADLSESMPDPSGYDFAAVGGPVRMGKLDKRTKEYLDKYEGALKQMRAGYFICCGFVDSADEYIKEQIPQSLRERSVICACFGGELRPKRARGLERFAIKMIMRDVLDEGNHDGELPTRSLPEIHPADIGRFAIALKESFR